MQNTQTTKAMAEMIARMAKQREEQLKLLKGYK